VLSRFACLLTAFSKKCSARGPSISSKNPSSLYGADAPLQGRDSNQGRPSPAREIKGRHTLIKSLLPWLTPKPLDPFCFDSGGGASIRGLGIYVYTGEVRKTASEGCGKVIWVRELCTHRLKKGGKAGFRDLCVHEKGILRGFWCTHRRENGEKRGWGIYVYMEEGRENTSEGCRTGIWVRDPCTHRMRNGPGTSMCTRKWHSVRVLVYT